MLRSRRLWIICAALFLVLFAACQKREQHYTIGYVGGLTGRSAGLGQEGRDAFLLAVEQFNRQGGVHGHKVEALVLDHGSTPAGIKAALQKMHDAGVVAVVGPMMSQIGVEMAPEAERLGLPLISPTVSTDALSDKQDLFFRPHYSDRQAAVKLAQLVASQHIGQVTIIQDDDNLSYVKSWNRAFTGAFPGMVETIDFSSSAAPLFSQLVAPLQQSPPGAVLILANAPDTGMICQQLAKQGSTMPMYATCWSASGPLVSYGGKSVEGLEFLHSINVNSTSEAYGKFSHDFLARYNRKHLFPAVHAYDATRILLHTLEEKRSNETVAEALLRLRTFQGLQYPLTFSDSGDLVDPPLFLTAVKDAQLCFVCYVD